MLGIDIDGTAQGTQFDHLAVGGAAALDGAVALVQGGAFDPALTTRFQFLTSASRTGSFDALVGSLLPSGKGYPSITPASAVFGSRLTVTAAPGTVAPPTLTDTDPDSFADDNSPEVKGTAPAGSDGRPLRDVGLQRSSGCGRHRGGVRLPGPHGLRRRQFCLIFHLPCHGDRRLGHLPLSRLRRSSTSRTPGRPT